MADDIFCLADGPRALDCLEFDDQLRFVDRVDDACFLAMDLEGSGPRLGSAFVGWYAEFSGDPAPPSLVHHYIAYRAFVRAKVAGLRAQQGAPTAAEARLMAEQAQRHLQAGAVTLTLVVAPPGTGRAPSPVRWPTVSAWWSSARTACARSWRGSTRRHPRRRRCTPASTTPGLRTGPTRSSPQQRAPLLALGESVVLDASWGSARHRAGARSVAHATSSDLREICCVAPGDLAVRRVAARPPRVDRCPTQTPRWPPHSPWSGRPGPRPSSSTRGWRPRSRWTRPPAWCGRSGCRSHDGPSR